MTRNRCDQTHRSLVCSWQPLIVITHSNVRLIGTEWCCWLPQIMACPNTGWGVGWGFNCETGHTRCQWCFFYNKTKQVLNEDA